MSIAKAGERFLVFGAGGHSKVVADLGRSAGLIAVGFLDDEPVRDGSTFFGLPIVAFERFMRERNTWQSVKVALGIGDNAARQQSFVRLQSLAVVPVTLVHARAVVAPSAELGAGTVVMAAAVVNPDATVGEGAIVNTGAVVEHDCRLGDFAHLSPNSALGGAVQLGERTHLGLGAVVLPGMVVGADVRVGAGAVVHRPVADGQTVVGVPARPMVRDQERRSPS